MYNNSRELLQFLNDSGIIPKARIAETEREASRIGRDTVTLLVQRGELSLDELRKIQSRIYGIKFVDLGSRKVPFDIMIRIPEPVARRHNTVMFDHDDSTAHIAVLDLDTLSVLDQVYQGPEKKIYYFATEDGMRKTLKEYQKELRSRYGESIRREAGFIANTASEHTFTDAVAVGHISVVKIVDTLLNHAVLSNASYIHIEAVDGDVTVRYRLGGRLYDAMVLPHYLHRPIVARIKRLANLDFKVKHMVQHGTFRVETDGANTQFHISINPTLDGEKVVMRVLGERSLGFMLESLGFSPRGLETIHHALKQRNGMILVSGPENSGKTTCLYTMLDALLSPDRSVGTIESPIEYDVRGVSQMRVNEKTGMTYSMGIKTLVQNDTDVIMVGSVDEAPALKAALRAASLHTLVLTGMTGRGAGHTLSLIVKESEDQGLVLSTVDVIISSRLIKTLGQDKSQYFLSASEIKKIEKIIDIDHFLEMLREDGLISSKAKTLGDVPFYKVGKDGYTGETGIYEVMSITRSIQDAVLKGGKARSIDEEAHKGGMLSFFEEGLYKAVLGITDLEQVFKIHKE